jgi:hypothetical protein
MDILDLKVDAAYEATHRRDDEAVRKLSDEELMWISKSRDYELLENKVGIVVFPQSSIDRVMKEKDLK